MVALAKRKADEFQAFYTSCNHITGYMVGLLECDSEMSILEPCAGDGAFIDELLSQNHKSSITAFEIDSKSVDNLINKYRTASNVHIQQADFAFLELEPIFDRVIGNPPYGAYQTPEKRARLKSTYPDIYAKETYGIFLVRAMELLKPNGRLVFIVPDTFLTLHMHEGLRNKILSEYKIESIALFPSKYFPGVNFGYAGLSIISIKKTRVSNEWCFPIYKGLSSPEELEALLTPKKESFVAGRLSYGKLKTNPSLSFYLSDESRVQTLLDQDLPTVDTICHVVTGFYSGNDAHYLRRANSVIRGAKKYASVDANLICDINHQLNPPLEGIVGKNHWVPIVKGGNRRFHKPSEWFMDWSKASVHDYKVVNKKKARFQNSRFYFSQGIAVPMVSSSSITGALIDGRLFDQSIVGIFPKEGMQHLLMYLLGFFNSRICNQLIRTINASTNNSSNYIKKIPIVIPEQCQLDEVSAIVCKLYDLAKNREIGESDLSEMNGYFDQIFGIKTHNPAVHTDAAR
jgi:hypothetical protein